MATITIGSRIKWYGADSLGPAAPRIARLVESPWAPRNEIALSPVAVVEQASVLVRAAASPASYGNELISSGPTLPFRRQGPRCVLPMLQRRAAQ